MSRRILILTEGKTNPRNAKTAASVIRYQTSQVVGLLDSTNVGKTAGELLDVGESIPVVGRIEDADDANTLLIGIASAGGKIPEEWRPILMAAIQRGMDIVCGLHDFLVDDAELVAAAKMNQVRLIDVRRNEERDVAQRENIREDCLRILTVGHDCCVGKMVVAIEIANFLKAQEHDAKFVATGQTGIMIEGEGCPIDCVVSDFLNGAVEKLILANQQHDILLFEGQGSISHPRYSAVTAGLLHGSMPHGMILCYEAGRTEVHGMPGHIIPPLAQLRETYESLANIQFPSQVIGIAMNSRSLTAEAAAEERQRIREEFNLPVCDVVRDGADELAAAVLSCRERLMSPSSP